MNPNETWVNGLACLGLMLSFLVPALWLTVRSERRRDLPEAPKRPTVPKVWSERDREHLRLIAELDRSVARHPAGQR